MVGVAVAALVYFLVPRFVPVLVPLGDDLPASTRVLLAAYPWAFVVPVAGVAIVRFVRGSPRGLLITLLGTYLMAAFIVIYIIWALYSPVYELASR